MVVGVQVRDDLIPVVELILSVVTVNIVHWRLEEEEAQCIYTLSDQRLFANLQIEQADFLHVLQSRDDPLLTGQILNTALQPVQFLALPFLTQHIVSREYTGM